MQAEKMNFEVELDWMDKIPQGGEILKKEAAVDV